ncbi:sigma-70 family RNA polymerase sigma factor [Actinocorallia longicatena]|uniref:RNA polymerase sigma factor 70 region 4 type 2 domain-containing protein n=1 Tax=Actinocorallia longicatena TaxID=111803 RepID=A0ABP6QEM2_9ACTN
MPDAQRSFVRLHDDHRDRVYAHAAERVAPSVAEDAVSETFEIAWRRFAEIPDEPLEWLLATASEVVVRIERAERREQTLAASAVQGPADAEADPALIVAERRALIEGARRLSFSDRQVLVLRAWHGMSSEEAARFLGISTPAYFVRLHRARHRFAALIAALGTAIALATAQLIVVDGGVFDPKPIVSPTTPPPAGLDLPRTPIPPEIVQRDQELYRPRRIEIPKVFGSVPRVDRRAPDWTMDGTFSPEGRERLMRMTVEAHWTSGRTARVSFLVGDVTDPAELRLPGSVPMWSTGMHDDGVEYAVFFRPRKQGGYGGFALLQDRGAVVVVESGTLTGQQMVGLAKAVKVA